MNAFNARTAQNRRTKTVAAYAGRFTGRLVVLGVLFSATGSAWAIDVTQSTGSSESDTGALKEIVVTAQKRRESAQDVPISITSLSSDTLQRQHIDNPLDLAMEVPGLTYNEFVGYSQPYLRGIGTDISQPNADPSVATYIDGVYVANAQGVFTSMLGTERVEVLVGPQGTLYGRNAVGGAINYYTLTPTQDFETKVNIGFGNYARKEASGYVSGPLSETLTVGLYGAALDRNTYLVRAYTPGPPGAPDDVTNVGGRIKAVYQPFAAFKLTGSFEITDSKSPEADSYRQADPNALGYYFGAPRVIEPRYSTNADFAQYNNTRQYAGTLREEYDLGFADLLGISGYRQLYGWGSADYDALPVALFSFGAPVDTRAQQYSQELQLLSPKGSPFQWIGGAYFFHERAGQYDFNEYSAYLFQPANRIQVLGRVTTNSYALFGQTTFPVTDSIRVTAGVRYSHDHKEFDGGQNVFDGNTLLVNVPVQEQQASWNNVSPKLVVDYRIAQTLLYASFSEGYKSGVYNINIPTSPGPVNPEKLYAYEIGSKSDFLGGRLRFNSSIYYYSLKDLQIQTVEPTSSGSTVLQNAASAKLKGVDLSLAAALTRELSINVGTSLEDAKYSSFPTFGAVAPAPAGNQTVFINASGNTLARAPRATASIGADYDHSFADGSQLNGTVKAHYSDKFYWDPSNYYRQSPYTLVNASVSYTLPTVPLTVMVWSTNLTNAYYNNILNASAFGIGVFDAPPRMYGINFIWHSTQHR
jgi:iron complex outermembrane receptor protein